MRHRAESSVNAINAGSAENANAAGSADNAGNVVSAESAKGQTLLRGNNHLEWLARICGYNYFPAAMGWV
jgi:hypothetical protein